MFIDTRDLNDSSPVRGDMTTGRTEADHRSFHAAPLGLVGFMERRCYKHVTPTGLAAPARNRCRGVTLIEMLVAVSLLVLIMGALFLSFYQVQRAYGVATSQQDVLEGGRAIASLVRRDLAGTSGANLPGVPNICATNVTAMPNSAGFINVIQDTFWITRNNDANFGVIYSVLFRGVGVGSLCRLEANAARDDSLTLSKFFGNYYNQDLTNASIVGEGVVRFRLTPFDEYGQVYVPTGDTNVVIRADHFSFNKGLPSYVELELGLLDQKTLRLYNAFKNVGSIQASNFLSDHPEKVHTFRQRIPIQNWQ